MADDLLFAMQVAGQVECRRLGPVLVLGVDGHGRPG